MDNARFWLFQCAAALTATAALSAQTPQPAVSYGYFHALALKSDGTVWTWGDNEDGQLGNGNTTNSYIPAQVAGLSGVVSISAGWWHNLAIRNDGSLWAWGDNQDGEIGSSDSSLVPVRVFAPSSTDPVIAVAGSYYFSVALLQDGSVWGWGQNWMGQLGSENNGGEDDSPVQIIAPSSTNPVIGISAGDYHVAALKSDGTVWTWGENYESQLGNGTTNSGTTAPVQVLTSGTALSGIVAVSCGDYHTIALKSDGTVWVWGANWYGELGNGTTTSSNQAIQVPGLSGTVTAISGGVTFSSVLKSDGTVWAWGYNGSGILGSGSAVTSPVQIGGLSSVASLGQNRGAVDTSGNIWGWGDNALGELGNPPYLDVDSPIQVMVGGTSAPVGGFVAVSGGEAQSLALNNDGTVWSWGEFQANGGTINSSTPVQISGLAGIIDIGGGIEGTVALKNDGSLWTLGYNEYGMLGNGSTVNYAYQPVQVGIFSSTAPAISIAAGYYHNLALKSDGTVWAWGNDQFGELGNGSISYSNFSTPAKITVDASSNAFGGVTAISAGGDLSLALKSDGTVWSWGSNDYGALGYSGIISGSLPAQISGLSGILAISAGFEDAAAVKNDGSVWTWGLNDNGQIGNGSADYYSFTPVQATGLTGAFAVTVGETYTVALKNDGTVWGWGLLGDGSTINSSTPVQISGLNGIVALEGRYDHILALKEDGSLTTFGLDANGEIADGGIQTSSSPLVVQGLNLMTSAPAVSITAPANNATVVLGTAASLQVNAATSGSGRSIASVAFYNENVVIGQSTVSPFTLTWSPPTWGNFDIKAVAIDNAGSPSAASSVVTLQVPFDSDSNGLPDWWELYYFGAIGQSGTAAAPSGNGLTILQSYQNGVSPIDFYNGVSPTLTIVSGTNQTGAPGALLSAPLVVKVTGTSGAPMVNAPVTFVVTMGAGVLAPDNSGTSATSNSLIALTGTNGHALIWFQQPFDASFTSTVAAYAEANEVDFGATTPVDNNPPAAPSNVFVIVQPDGSTQVTWKDNSDNETGFSIQTSNDWGSTWITVGTVGANIANYLIPTGQGVITGTTQVNVIANASGGGGTPAVNPPTAFAPIPRTNYATIDVSGTNAPVDVISMAFGDNDQAAYCFVSAGGTFAIPFSLYGISGTASGTDAITECIWNSGTTTSTNQISSGTNIQAGTTGSGIQALMDESLTAPFLNSSGTAYGTLNQTVFIQWPFSYLLNPGPTYMTNVYSWFPSSGTSQQAIQILDFENSSFTTSLSNFLPVISSTTPIADWNGDGAGASIYGCSNVGYCGYGIFACNGVVPNYPNLYTSAYTGNFFASFICVTSGSINTGTTIFYDPTINNNANLESNIPSTFNQVQTAFYPSVMNDNGCVIGTSNSWGGGSSYWGGGQQLVSLGSNSWAEGLNNQNMVIGYSDTTDPNSAALWLMNSGSSVNLRSLLPQLYQSEVHSIYPLAISNADSNNRVSILCNAWVPDSSGTGSLVSTWEQIVLNVDATTPAGNTALSGTTPPPQIEIVKMPRNITFQNQEALAINSGGLISGIGTITTGTTTSLQKALLLLPVEPFAPVIYMFSGHDSDTVTLSAANVSGWNYQWQLKYSGGAQGQFSQNQSQTTWSSTGTTSTVIFRAGVAGVSSVSGDTRAQASGTNTIQLLINGTCCWEKPLDVIKILPRSSWGALPPVLSKMSGMSGINELTVHHSSREAFGTAEIQRIQKEHMGLLNGWFALHPHPAWGDIGYHFILDPSNDSDPNTVLLYEGRQLEGLGLSGGPYTIPSAVLNKNTLSGIDICVLGNYETGSSYAWLKGNESFSEIRRKKLEEVLTAFSFRYKAPVAITNYPQEPIATPPISYHQKLASLPPVYESTECPGNTVISTMTTTENKVKNDLK